MFFDAILQARHYTDTQPNSLKASTWAWYMAMEARQQGRPSITLAAIDRSRKRDGYIGHGAIERYEKEILAPMVIACEREKARKRAAEQAEIDSVVEHILQSIGDCY
jgi:hypothetical protein